MPTLCLVLEYDGAPYNGWQIQANGIGVQALIQTAVRRMTKEKNHIVGASRTDAGVHAVGQVAHFHTRRTIPVLGWLRGINSLLPPTIRVRDVRAMPDHFHARNDAQWKRYQYRIVQGAYCPPFAHRRVWHIARPLNARAMQRAARWLVGKHDFRALAAANDANRSKVRTIFSLRIRKEEGMLVFDVVGNGFLKQMVRNIVGTLVEIGEGKRAPDTMHAIVASRDRRSAGRCAPPDGLCLIHVSYTKY